MNEDYKKDLIKAYELKTIGSNREAVKFYKKAYNENPDDFTINQRFDFAWSIYKTGVVYYKSEEELFSEALLITELVPQRDLNSEYNCVYTSAVFKVLNYLDDQGEYYLMLDWIEKLDVELLDEKPFYKYNRINKSKKEKYYDWLSNAYYKTGDYEKCIEVSSVALDTFNRFIDEGDVWHKWRIARSLKELNHLKESLLYFNEVIEVRKEDYIYKDIAETYYLLNKPYDALDYLCPAVLSDEPNSKKADLYYLCYKVFNLFNPEMALKHAQLCYLINKENNYAIPYGIKEYDFDDRKLDKTEIETEIESLWIQYREYKNKK